MDEMELYRNFTLRKMIILRNMDEFWSCLKILASYGHTWQDGNMADSPNNLMVENMRNVFVRGQEQYIRLGWYGGIVKGLVERSAMQSYGYVYFSEIVSNKKMFTYL